MLGTSRRFSPAAHARKRRWIKRPSLRIPGDNYLDTHRFIFDDVAAGINPNARTIVVYDPRSLDVEHVKLIRACGPIEDLIVPFSGHRPLWVLAEMGLASKLVREAATGQFDLHAMRREVRARRNQSATYLRYAARALDIRRRAGVLTLLHRAAEVHAPIDVSKLMEDISRLVVHNDLDLAKGHLKALLENDMFVGRPRHVSFVIKMAPVLTDPSMLPSADAALRPRMGDSNRAVRMCAALMLASVQIADGEFEVARETLAQASANGADAVLPMESARLQDAIGDHDTAIAIGKAAHSADPGNAEIADFLAVLLEKKNDPASALTVLREADAILPLKIRQHRLRLARLLYKAGERDDSISICDRILAKDPAYVPALRLRALLFVASNSPDKAIADFQILSQIPRYAIDGFVGLARTFSLVDDRKAAMAAAQEALRLEPGRRDMARLIDQLGRRQN
jgi:tetratricopeptide (TPR) repeat protein